MSCQEETYIGFVAFQLGRELEVGHGEIGMSATDRAG